MSPGPALDRPVLVCGVGRSGTSLVQSMLNAHPAVAVPPETHFFRRYVAAPARRRRLEASSLPAVREELERDTYLARAALDVERLLAAERPGAVDLARVYRTLLAAYAERAGKPRAGDKDPRMLDEPLALRDTLPAARVIHLVRDPRDVLLSRTRAAWAASRPWWSHVFACREQLRRGRERGRRLFGEAWLEVRYEELVVDPESSLRSICAHIEVDYDPAMLAFSESAKGLVGADELAWKRETLGPLLPGNREKWRSELSPLQVRFVETAGGDWFEELGYERAQPTPTVGPLARVALGCAPAIGAATSCALGLRRIWERRSA